MPAGSEGLVCLPYFAGERTPLDDPHARGVFAGLALQHTRGHLYRSVLEGIGFGLRQNLEVMAEMNAVPDRIVAVGGGARNELWLQIMTDITGIPQDLPERTTGAAYGDAFLAGLASGIVPSLESLQSDWVRVARTIEPDHSVKPLYDDHYGIFRRLYASTRDDIHRLAHQSPGHPG